MDKTAGVVMVFSNEGNIHVVNIDKLAISVIKDKADAKEFVNTVSPLIAGTLLKASYTTVEPIDLS